MSTVPAAGVEHPHPHLVRNLTVALIAALVAAVVALSIALATEGGSSSSTQIRVVPSGSGPIPPSPAERNQPPGMQTPGFRP